MVKLKSAGGRVIYKINVTLAKFHAEQGCNCSRRSFEIHRN